jgi:hypothetical protein
MNKNIQDLDGEIWKDVLGFEGYYQISNKGRIKSLERCVKGKNKSYLTLKSRLYEGYVCKKGYIRMTLSKNHKMIRKYVHNLVADAFIPNIHNKPQINHRDGNKKNNIVDNLEWCTCIENISHAKENNLLNPLYGEYHGCAKLLNKDICLIRKELRTKTSRSLSKKYNVSESVISQIKQNTTYIKKLPPTKEEIRKVSSFYNKVEIFDLFGNFIEEFNTQKDFCLKYSKSQGNLSRAFGGKLETKIWGFIIKRKVN